MFHTLSGTCYRDPHNRFLSSRTEDHALPQFDLPQIESWLTFFVSAYSGHTGTDKSFDPLPFLEYFTKNKKHSTYDDEKTNCCHILVIVSSGVSRVFSFLLHHLSLQKLGTNNIISVLT